VVLVAASPQSAAQNWEVLHKNDGRFMRLCAKPTSAASLTKRGPWFNASRVWNQSVFARVLPGSFVSVSASELTLSRPLAGRGPAASSSASRYELTHLEIGSSPLSLDVCRKAQPKGLADRAA